MKTVALGISGGVDSSVAAILLKNKGYNVIGFTLILNDNFDINDAKKVCKQLQIEHIVIDLKKEFKKYIIDNFIEKYEDGLTPNPCVLCNKYIKFGIVYDELLKSKADFIATGHYAKIIDNKLYKAKDKNKDQTYFLYNLTKEKLSKIIFPLADLTKDEVKKIAQEHNLITANQKESNDICFIKNGFKEYMKTNSKQIMGPVINIETNKQIGEHPSITLYTIGQRKGLNIGGNESKLHIVKKENNILYVSFKKHFSNSCTLKDINIINESNILTAKFRYGKKEIPIELIGNKVIFKEKIEFVSPGQSCVFYNNNECVGGGIIDKVN